VIRSHFTSSKRRCTTATGSSAFFAAVTEIAALRTEMTLPLPADGSLAA